MHYFVDMNQDRKQYGCCCAQNIGCLVSCLVTCTGAYLAGNAVENTLETLSKIAANCAAMALHPATIEILTMTAISAYSIDILALSSLEKLRRVLSIGVHSSVLVPGLPRRDCTPKRHWFSLENPWRLVVSNNC